MNIEILHIDKCPSWKFGEAHAREALATLGRADIPVITRLLTNAEEAARTAFADSPVRRR